MGLKVVNGCRLYLHYVSINIKSMMQYKISFLLSSIGLFLTSFSVFLGIYFMFQRFTKIGEFSYGDVVICYGVVLLEYSLAEMFARGFDAFPSMVKSGSFDQVLVRPRNEILQVLGSKFELTRISRMIQAIVMFIYGVVKCDVEWNLMKIMTVIFMIIGGTVVFSGLFLIYAALCFFTLDGLEFMNIFTDGAREYGKYPIGVYGEKMLLFTTFVVPYSLVQYYPILFILDKSDNILYTIFPIVAAIFIIPCYFLWRFGVRRYKSSGS